MAFALAPVALAACRAPPGTCVGGARACFLAAVALAAMCGAAIAEDAPRVPVDAEQRIEVLTFLAAENEANYRKLRTWQGHIRLEDAVDVEEPPEGGPNGAATAPKERSAPAVMPASVDFVANLASDSLYTTYIRESAGESAPETHLFARRSVVTPVHFLHLDPNGIVGELEDQANLPGFPRVGRVAYREEPKHGERLMAYSSVVDPRRFFWSSSLPTFEALRGYATRLQETEDFPVTIEKLEGSDPAVYFVAVGSGMHRDGRHPRPARVVTQRIEASAGCNVTSRVRASADGDILEEADVEYALVDGIFLPTTYHLRRFHRDGGVQLERKFVFVDQVVNKLVEPSTFTLAHLGLKDGERVVDKIDGGLRIYKRGHLIDPNAALDPATDSTQPDRAASGATPSRFPRIILISVGLIGAIAAMVLLRRSRRQRRRNSAIGSTAAPKT